MNKTLRDSLIVAGGACALWKLYRYSIEQQRTFSFRNRVVLITGSSRGLGLVLARQLAEQGALLAICARDPLELETAAAELRSRGARVVTFVCDLTVPAQITELVEYTQNQLGPVDVLINNAGMIQVGPARNMTMKDNEDALKLHLWTPIHTTNAVLPQMWRRSFGRIVNIASIGGELSVPHLLPYCISKFALVGYSRGIAYELAQKGIYVTTICPGLMRTGSHLHAWFKGQPRAEFSWFSISASLPLLSMDAERAAREILQATSRGQSHLTLGLPAKVATWMNALSPELVSYMMSAAASLLPDGNELSTSATEGRESSSVWSPSWITQLGDQAALRNNEAS